MFPYQPPFLMPSPMGMPAVMPIGLLAPMPRMQMAIRLTEPRLMLSPMMPLLPVAAGGFPVPESIDVEQLPPSSAESYLRLVEGGPKPAVTKEVMEETQFTMIKPDLPCRARV